MDLEAAHARAEADLARAERQLNALTRRVEELRTEKTGLELAMARHGGATPDRGGDQHPTFGPTPGPTLSRTDAILKVLEERTSDEPLAPGAVVEMLRGMGRQGDTPHNVSAALSYLRRHGRVQSQGRGRWVLTARPLRPLTLAARYSEPPTDDDAPLPEEEPEWDDYILDEVDQIA